GVAAVVRCYFFFQAEDGIRGPLVTGVQTCALPIARAERAPQGEAATRLRRLGHKQPLLRTDAEDNAICHVQPPETAGRIVTTSPGPSSVSSPSRSRMCQVFTNRLTCRRTVPVSSQMLRCSAGWRRWSSSRTARKLDPRSASSDAPAQHVRSGAGTWTVIVVARAKALAGVSWGGMEPGEV